MSALIVVAAIAAPSISAGTTVPAVGGPIPVEAFVDTPFLDSPVISPDGTHFAARNRVGDTAQIMVFSTEAATPVRVVALGELDLASITWAGNGRLLLRVSYPQVLFGISFPVVRLLCVDVASGVVSVLDKRNHGIVGGDLLYVDPSGQWLLVSSQASIYTTPSVKRVDLMTGIATIVEQPRDNVWSWYADRSGVVRAGVAYSGDRWKIWYRSDATAPLKPIRGRTDADGEDGTVEDIRFLPNSGSGVMITNARTGRFGAYRYDLNSGEMGAALYENPAVDIAGLVIGDDTGAVDGVAYTDDRYRVNWLNPKRAEIQTRIDKALPNKENIVLNSSHDGKRMIIWSGAADDPGSYFLYDRDKRELRILATPYAAFDDVKLTPVRSIRYAARDGLQIPGYLTMPTDRPDKALPLIVMPHGGPYARDNWDFDPWVQFLASRGYAVLQPNFRGSTGYGRDYAEKGYGQWGRAMQDDIDDGVAWLVASGRVDPKRVCIFGASYGGYAAMWGAIRNPELYRCAISVSGVSDIPAILKYDRGLFTAKRYYRLWENKVRGLEQVDLASVSPLLQSERLTIPMLIVHGENDTRVPVKQSKAMIAALQKRKFTVESAFYAGEGHSFVKRENKLDFLKRLEAFLAKHNPA